MHPTTGAGRNLGHSLAEQAGTTVHTAMAQHFVDAQYVWTSFLLEHLVAVRRRFSDLDTALLLTVIGLSALKAAQAGEAPNVSVNAHSLALVTGIPRETVRRKLAALGRRGWIEPAPAGGWQLAAQPDQQIRAQHELEDLTQATQRQLANLVEQLVRIGMRTSSRPD